MENYLPYIISAICALISGIMSYGLARRQSKEDLRKLEKTYELDIEKLKEIHKQEIEKLEIEHNNEMELLQRQFENQIGGGIINTTISEVLKNPETQKELSKALNKGFNKK